MADQSQGWNVVKSVPDVETAKPAKPASPEATDGWNVVASQPDEAAQPAAPPQPYAAPVQQPYTPQGPELGMPHPAPPVAQPAQPVAPTPVARPFVPMRAQPASTGRPETQGPELGMPHPVTGGGLPSPADVDALTTQHAQTIAAALNGPAPGLNSDGTPAPGNSMTPGKPGSATYRAPVGPTLAAPTAPTFQNPRTGRISVRQQPGVERGPLSILDMPVTGGQEIGAGVSQIQQPGWDAKAGGASKILRGAFEASTPFMLPSMAATPLVTAAALAAGGISQQAVEAGLTKIGVSPGLSAFAGDIAGLIAGIAGHKISSPAAAALKAKYEPILKARAAQASAPPPPATANSTGTEPYQPGSTPPPAPAQPVAATPAPNVQAVAKTPQSPPKAVTALDPLKRLKGEKYSAWQDRINGPKHGPETAPPGWNVVKSTPTPAAELQKPLILSAAPAKPAETPAAKPAQTLAAEPEPTKAVPTWRDQIHPTVTINGISTEHPSTHKLVGALEAEFVRRGLVPADKIGHLRRAAFGTEELGRPGYADDYARPLQKYLLDLDAGKTPKPLAGLPAAEAAPAPKKPTTPQIEHGVGGEGTKYVLPSFVTAPHVKGAKGPTRMEQIRAIQRRDGSTQAEAARTLVAAEKKYGVEPPAETHDWKSAPWGSYGEFQADAWRTPHLDGHHDESGAFFAEDQEEASRYNRKQGINASYEEKLRLKKAYFAYDKADALKEFGLKELQDKYVSGELAGDHDPDFLIDRAIAKAAREDGYDGIVYSSDSDGYRSVHVFNPPAAPHIPGFSAPPAQTTAATAEKPAVVRVKKIAAARKDGATFKEAVAQVDAEPAQTTAAEPEPTKAVPTWRDQIHPTVTINGISTEHPSTHKLVGALEAEFVRRGLVPADKIGHLRRAAFGTEELGRPGYADDYARPLQKYLLDLDAGKTPKPLAGLPAAEAAPAPKKPTTPQIEHGVGGEGTPHVNAAIDKVLAEKPAVVRVKKIAAARKDGATFKEAVAKVDAEPAQTTAAPVKAPRPSIHEPVTLVIQPLHGGAPEKLTLPAVPSPPDSPPVAKIEAEAHPPAEAPDKEPGHIALANTVVRMLQQGETIGNNIQFQKLADEAFGGSRAAGKYDMKQAYDALEAGVNRYIADSIGPDLLTGDPGYALQQLRELMTRLPTQNIRTENQELLQQFSTPPTLAFLVAKLGSIRAADTVLEPSAGTGSLAAWAKAANAIVRTNEIDPRRAELLSYAVRGSNPTSHDAEYLHATLPPDIKPTVVVMNPPFSATGGRLTANKNTFGYAHVIEALKRLQPGGRLVAILGEGAKPNAPNARGFWADIKRYGTLRANVGISGKEYAKYGTTFGNRVIVIDKVAPDQFHVPGTEQFRGGDYDTIEAAYAVLGPILERPDSPAVVRAGEHPGGSTGREPEVPGERSGGAGPVLAGSPVANVPAPRPGKGARADAGQKSGAEAAGSPAGSQVPAAQAGTSLTGDSGGSAIEPPRPEDRIALESRKQEDFQNHKEDDSSFVEYVPSIEGLAHPGRLVETKVMASVNPPKVTYTPNLPKNAKAPKPLSGAQMEAVARAGMMHQTFTGEGQRSGFLLGDGTGVGKGQEIAAMIWDRYRSGQKRSLWVSASKGLQKAAKGDFLGIGATELAEKLHSINTWNAAEDIPLKDGVLFTTYQSLIAKAKGETGQTRLDQIKKWLGEDGVIVFDEAQKGKNAVASGARAVSSKTGGSVVKLQDDLPKSYVVYASATAATDVNNLGYMTRMGLWGKGTPFHQGFGHFMNEVGRGGIAAMELISREMKAAGKYLSRSISYKGVSYDEHIHELTPEQRETYDTAARAWQLVLDSALQQVRDNGGDGRAVGEFTQRYWGTHQRFFRRVLTAMKVPAVIEQTDKALAEGKSVVISLIGTGAAAAEKAMASGAAEDADDLDFSPKDSLIDMVRDSFPTVLYEDYQTDSGSIAKRPVMRDGKVVQNPEAIAKRDELTEKLNRELQLPDNPLDFIVRNYGRAHVSELTSRHKTLERNKQTGKWESVTRAPEGVAMDKVNEHEMEQFQNGKKRIAIISKASGAGFSLHADLAAKNQQPRLHIVMELSWSADDQMQSFGRTHRSNQKQPPQFVIVSTDAGGEKRFSSTIARRLESLGALTKGQRDASGGGSVLAKYNFETQQGEEAARAFYRHLATDAPIEGSQYTGLQILKQMGILKQRTNAAGEPQGLPYVDTTDETNVTRLMNRILNIELGAEPDNPQNATFALFTDLFDQAVKRAIENGTLDTGVNLVRGDSVKLKQAKEIAKDPASGAQTFRYVLEVERKNKPVPTSEVEKLAAEDKGQMMMRREFRGAAIPDQLLWVRKSRTPITDRHGAVQPAYNTFGPAHRETATSYDRISQGDLATNWEPIEGANNLRDLAAFDKRVADAEKYLKDHPEKDLQRHEVYTFDFYRKELVEAKSSRKNTLAKIEAARLNQFQLWEQAVQAAPEARHERIDMIGGSVMRVWPLLRIGEGRVDIRIAYPEGGGSITGVAMSESDANAVEHSLTGNVVVRTPASVFDQIIGGRGQVELSGGVRLAQGRINREPVVELFSSSPENQRFFRQSGAQQEKVGWTYRYYVPNDKAAALPILEKILAQFPETQRPARTSESGAATLNVMTLGLAKFVGEDVAPVVANVAAGIRDTSDDILKVLAPTVRDRNSQAGSLILRGKLAELARKSDQAQAALDQAHRYFEKRPAAENYDFIDRIETGQKQTTPELDVIAGVLRKLLDTRKADVQSLGTGKLQTFYENYFPHIWKKPTRAASVFAAFFGKRPLEGGKSFLKKRTLPTIADGLAAGLEPISDNPVDLVLAKVHEMDRYVMAHETLAEWKKDGLAKFERSLKPPPAGWARIDDSISTVYGRNAAGETIIRGHYYAPEGAARILNNYLSPGLRKFGAYNALFGLNNVLNQFQLGLSAFHLGFTAADTTVSKAALGYQALLRGKPLQAAKFFAQTPTAAFTTMLEGNKILKEWYRPGSQGAPIGKIANDLVTAGGRARMDAIYQTHIHTNMMAALRRGNIWGAALRAPFAGVEALSNLLMNQVVPRMKLGAFADLARFHMENMPAGSTFEQTRQVLAQDWNSIENRLGEMTYDNLFWNKIAKDLALITVRSVGWNLGTLREVGGGIIDMGLQPANALRGKPVNLNRLSYILGLVTVTATMSAIYQYLKTGKGPDELKDYFFPKNGELDEQGRAQRSSLPTYVKDVYHYSTHPIKTLEGKVAPIWSLLSEMIHNKDFYGVAIRNEDDPLVQQLGELAKHAASTALPIGVRNYQRETKLGSSLGTRAEQFVGVSPAPGDINQSPAERMAREFAAARVPDEPRTKASAERRDLRQSLARALRQGKAIPADVLAAIKAGTLTKRDREEAKRESHRSSLVNSFTHLGIAEAMRVFRAATDEEKDELRGPLLKKARAAMHDMGPEMREKTREELGQVLQ